MMFNNIRLVCALIILLISSLSFGAKAESDQVTCTGMLTEAETRTSAWPVGVIQDTSGHYFCMIDRSASGHDLLKACSLGGKCSVIGTFHKVGPTYSILRIISASPAE
jgi:hypothetical protein